jgi:outer membrane protein assembly factor BamB
MTEQVFSSPTAADGVLIASGKVFSGGTQAVAVRLGGRGNVTDTHRLWQQRLPKECVGSPVVTGGNVYLVTQFGTAVCLELATGKKLAEKRLTGGGGLSGSWSSPVLADGKLYVPNQSGDVFVIRATPELEVLATNSVGEETTCASLAISGGRIFLRTYKGLWCIGK